MLSAEKQGLERKQCTLVSYSDGEGQLLGVSEHTDINNSCGA